MQTLPISSSLIRAASYDEERQELHVTFKDGARWAYGNNLQPFTPEDLGMLMGASSKGSWFLQQIRDTFPARRL